MEPQVENQEICLDCRMNAVKRRMFAPNRSLIPGVDHVTKEE